MNIIGVIPARFGSSRLPGKPLIEIEGKPLIQYVYERAQRLRKLDKLLVATDDERIFNKVRQFGGQAKLTSAECNSGSDRVAEVIKDISCDVVVNIQGDEPFFEPATVEEMIEALIENPEIQISSACVRVRNPEEIKNENVVKVVLDKDDFALYFSRSPIPCFQEGRGEVFKHLGFYAFRRDFLLKFTQWPATPLEKAEKLEQLRILENGYRIKLVKSRFDSLGIDTTEDFKKAKEVLKRFLKNPEISLKTGI